MHSAEPPATPPPQSIELQLPHGRTRLWSSRGMDLPDHQIAFIADPHWGKSATFRGFGLPAPETSPRDLLRLSNFLNACHARHLIFLGDFYHAQKGRTEAVDEALHLWRQNHSELRITLVRGNHDKASGDPPPSLDIQCVSEPYECVPHIHARHFPQTFPQITTFAGHLHPGLSLRSRHGARITAPCFWIQPQQIVMPAFGSFTGIERIHPSPHDRCILVSDHEIVEWPPHPPPT